MDHNAARESVIRQVEAAFANVRLEDGVGLKQGQGIDDYESDEVCNAYRQSDEKFDWRRIPMEKLEACHSSLSFFDAKGMRFHLPAYIIADLRGSKEDAVFMLTHLDEYNRERLSLLSLEQRAAIASYLRLLLADQDDEYGGSDIRTALQDYWES